MLNLPCEEQGKGIPVEGRTNLKMQRLKLYRFPFKGPFIYVQTWSSSSGRVLSYLYCGHTHEAEKRQISGSQGCRAHGGHVVQFSHSVNETRED